jgi:hypothetical protein
MERDSEETVMIVEHSRVSRSDDHVDTEIEFMAIKKQWVINISLDDCALVDLSAKLTVLVSFSDDCLFSIVHWLNTSSLMSTSTDFSNINDSLIGLFFEILGTVEFLEEVSALILVTKNPSLGEELIVVEAVRSVFELLSVFNDRFSSVILSVDCGTSWNVISDLCEAAKVFSKVLISVNSDVGKEEVNIRSDIVDPFLLQSLGHLSADLRMSVSTEDFKSFFSDERAWDVISEEIGLIEDEFRVICEVGSVLNAVFRVRFQAHPGFVVLVHDLWEIVVVFVVDRLEGIDFAENVKGSDGIVKAVGIVIGIENSGHAFRIAIGIEVVADEDNSKEIGN